MEDHDKRELRKNVRRGARWLDEHVPTWADEVDAEILDLNSTCSCVIGQLADRKVMPAWYDFDSEDHFDLLALLGFSVPEQIPMGDDVKDYYGYLTSRWCEEIRTRKETDAV